MDKTNELATLEKKFLKGQIPFAIDEKNYKRFSRRNNIFSRVVWDKSYKMYRRAITERERNKVGIKGYSRVDYALRAASWTVYDNFKEAFAWKLEKKEEREEENLTQLVSTLPKYEANDIKYNTEIIKKAALVFGSCEVGITKIDPEKLFFIYSHDSDGSPIDFPKDLTYAIVMLVEMDYQALGTSPALPASTTTGEAYSRMAFLQACMAEFIRNLGYKAIPSGNDTALSIPLAIQAGLGQLGRNGLLINPKRGQRIRICKVFTDLPLLEDRPIDFGVIDFCRVCKKCAKYCPSQSISYDDKPSWTSPYGIVSNNNYVYKWYVNVESCYEFWVKNSSDCSNCMRVCPFTKPPGFVHSIPRFFIKHFRFLDRFWVLLDNIMGKFPMWRYGKKKDPNKFWKSNRYLDRKF